MGSTPTCQLNCLTPPWFDVLQRPQASTRTPFYAISKFKMMTKSCFYEAKEKVPPAIKQYKNRGNSSNLQSHSGCPQLKELESGIAPLVRRGFYPTCWGLNHPPPSPKDLQTTETFKRLLNYLQTTCKRLAKCLQKTCNIRHTHTHTQTHTYTNTHAKTCNIRHTHTHTKTNTGKDLQHKAQANSQGRFAERVFEQIYKEIIFFAANFPTKVGWCAYFVRFAERVLLQIYRGFIFGRKTSPGTRGGGLGSSTIFKKFHEPYAPS